jgi:hypothetical protein
MTEVRSLDRSTGIWHPTTTSLSMTEAERKADEKLRDRQTQRKAIKVLAALAIDADDLIELLDALGLDPAITRTEEN